MVPMRDGVSLRSMSTCRTMPGPGRPCSSAFPYDKNGRYCWMPQIARHFTDRGYVFLVQDVRGKFRSGGEVNRSSTRSTTATTRSTGSLGSRGRAERSGCGATPTTGSCSGRRSRPGTRRCRAIVPRVTVADLFDWLDGVTPLYGAHYLAQYWTDSLTHHWTPDWTQRPLCEVFDDAFAAIGARSIAFDRLLAEERGQAGADLYANGHPFDRLRIPTLHGVGWFDNITPSHMLDYERLMDDPETAPYQYLHAGSTDHENYRFDDVPVPAPRRPRHERRRPRADAPALPRAGARLLRRVPDGSHRPRSVPRVRWHLGNDGWHESPSWPPPGADEARLYLSAGGDLEGEPGSPGEVAWLHDPPTSSRRRSSTRSRSCSSIRTRARWPPGPTWPFHGRAAGGADDARRPRRRSPLRRKRRPVDVRARQARGRGSGRCVHTLLYGQEFVERPDGRRRCRRTWGTPATGMPAGHRLRLQVASSDYPLYVPHPGTSESPWFAIETAANRQHVLTGGSTPSHVSFTVLEA